jgi:hypothetical protein
MSNSEEEGEDFLAIFKGQYATNMDDVKQRMARERKAGRSAAQKARKKPPTTQKNFRATATTLAQLEALAKHLNLNDTAVIAMAIDELAKVRVGVKK